MAPALSFIIELAKLPQRDMRKVKMRNDNARHSEQLERMRRLAKGIGCFFCKKNYLKVGASPAIYQGQHWYIKKNDYPYEGSIHHYLIVNKKHLNKITEISPAAWKELLKTIAWLEKYLKIKGGSIFVRSGDMGYTGATLNHLHFHLLVGGKKKRGGKLRDNILVTLGHKSARHLHS